MEKYNLSEDEVENVFYKMNNMEIESKIDQVTIAVSVNEKADYILPVSALSFALIAILPN